MRSPGRDRYAPLVRAARVAAAPGSVTIRHASHSRRRARRMSSSLTRTTCGTNRVAIPSAIMPARCAPSASAATPPTSTSTTSPAASARDRVGQRWGSTPITRVSVAYHAATPAMSPPPPTATMTVSSAGAWPDSSAAKVPCPATTAG